MGTRSTRQATPAARASAQVALAAAGPEAGGDGVGGREQQAVGAGAVAVGHDHHPARGRDPRRSAAARRARRGRAWGSRRARTARARCPRRARARTPSAAAAGWPRSCIVLDHDRPLRTRGRRHGALAGDEDRALDRRRSARARAARPRPSLRRARSRSWSATLAPRRCLARAKRLTGRIAAVRIWRRR